MKTDWNKLYAHRLAWMNTSLIREILKTALSPDTISMAGGWPDAGLFPVAQFQELAQYVLANQPCESLQYGLTDGLPALRQMIAGYTTAQGVPCGIENVVITSGSTQALDLVSRLFLDEGDVVLVQNPTFLGALQSFNAYGIHYLPVAIDEEGLSLDGLEEQIAERRPKFMYLIPNFQNPTGVTMSLSRREQMLELASHYGVAIIEDDPYGQLRFEGLPVPTLLQLASRASSANCSCYQEGHVLYLSTFSKLLCPGFRVGWMVCPPPVAQQLVMAKQGADLQTNALAQTITHEFMRRGWLEPQTERIRATYRQRRNAMYDALAEYLPEVRHTRPEGGLFLWITLPEGMDAAELLVQAAKHNVAFIPGSPFYVDGSGRNTVRLSFATLPPEMIREGIRLLALVIREEGL